MEEQQQLWLNRLKAVNGSYCKVLTKLAEEMDNLLANQSLWNEAITNLNIGCEQLGRKIKVLTTIEGDIVSHCYVDNITHKTTKSEGIIAKLIECK